MRQRAVRCVVIVRDEGRCWQPLASTLAAMFVVRLAANASELMEHLVPIERVACVCVVNDGVRLRDVHEALVRAGGAAERLVFVSEDDVASPAGLAGISRVVRRLASL
ncbi:MAG TPA: hypothetical protein VGH87_24170 [Polyangiaceae bacterium]|nr:hypothetical protein [Polyangiaceae bacterium]